MHRKEPYPFADAEASPLFRVPATNFSFLIRSLIPISAHLPIFVSTLTSVICTSTSFFPLAIFRLIVFTFARAGAPDASDADFASCSAYVSSCCLKPKLGHTIPRRAWTYSTAAVAVGAVRVEMRYAATTVALRLIPYSMCMSAVLFL